MRKIKDFKNIIKKVISLILILIVLSININTFAVVLTESRKTTENDNGMQTQKINNNIVRIADLSTVDSYKEIMNAQGGRYNGLVWSDKSVYANNGNGQVTLDNKFNIKYDDDFLTVFSALGSSQAVKQKTAMDMSIIIDVSGSMGIDVVDGLEHEESEVRIAHSRIQATITAVNNTIEELMNYNEKNRVCVIVYGGTAYTLMELGHYTKVDNREYITVENFKKYQENEFSKQGSCAYTLRTYAKKDNNETINRTVRNNYKDSCKSMSEEEKVDQYIGFHTNMQAGIYKGFEELYNSATNNDDGVIRFPTAIIMSDGGSNYALKAANNLPEGEESEITGDEWHNVPIVDSLDNYSTSYKKYRTEVNEMERGGKETILDILMTASYMKAKVQKKYEELFEKSSTVKNDNQIEFKIHTVSVDTEEINTNWQVPRIYTTLDPRNFFKKDLLDVTWEFKQESTEAYDLWQQWQSSPTGISTVFQDSDKEDINFKINKLQEDDEVTNEEIIQNIYYNDSFSDITSAELDSFFSDIISNIAFKPIGDSLDSKEDINDLSYVDPIGKYMEIKEVKKLLLFGKEYNIIEDGEPIIDNTDEQKVSRQYYKAVDSNNGDLEIINPSYENVTKFKLSDIKIWKEFDYENVDTNYDESLHIVLPSDAIPIHLDKIELDESNKVKEYQTNKDTDAALPTRVVYTVGISNQIINEETGKIDLTKISKEYLTKNTEEIGDKKNICFFSNYYDGKIYNEEISETIGNSAVTFTPSSENRFYIFQKNLTIYEQSSGGDDKGEGELKETEGNVVLSEPLTDIEQINPEKTYYFAIDYYVPQENSDGSKGKYVQYATSHKGTEFFSEKGECYLTYYNTVNKHIVDNKEENAVVVTKKGARRIGNLINLSNKKEENTTNTAEFYNAPSYGILQDNGSNSITENLGNNGKLAVQLDLGSVKIKKVDKKGNALEGATFGLYAKEEIALNADEVYKAGEEIERKTTDKDGTIEFKNLYLGKYEIKEIEAPQGYELLKEAKEFEVTDENLELEFTIENILKEVPPKDESQNEKVTEEETIKQQVVEYKNSDERAPISTLPETGQTKDLILVTVIIDFISFSVIFYKKYKKYNY